MEQSHRPDGTTNRNAHRIPASATARPSMREVAKATDVAARHLRGQKK